MVDNFECPIKVDDVYRNKFYVSILNFYAIMLIAHVKSNNMRKNTFLLIKATITEAIFYQKSTLFDSYSLLSV
jgi:hypothetical protein